MFIPKNEIQWKNIGFLRKGDSFDYEYYLWLNEPLASWDVYDYWERPRVESMSQNLKKGDILFDVGTEQGWCDLVYAHIVGPENMVLVEPTPEFWPNIQALWEKNFPGVMPKACYNGFFSDKSSLHNTVSLDCFPDASDGDLIDRNSYKNLSDESHRAVVNQITIDELVADSEIMPTALTIDVEGAELLVLKGAEKTLSENNVKVWVSEHDDLAKTGYNVEPKDVASFMASLGYIGINLGTDHERHVYYYK